MKRNVKKKSAVIWLHRLFQQSGNHAVSSLGKRPYSRVYADRPEASSSSDLGLWFSDPEDAERRSFSPILPKHISSVADGGASPPFVSTGLRPDVYSASGSKSFREFTVLNIFQETFDTKTFRFRQKDGRDFSYLPGQYVILMTEIGGAIYKRSYSLVSSPLRLGTIEITVKRVDGGLVSNWLNDSLMIGDTVNIKGPFGNFSCEKRLNDKLLFIAAGSGVAPAMSMLRWLTDSGSQADIVLMLSFKTQLDIIYRDELMFIKSRHPNIKLFITLTQEKSEYLHPAINVGRINRNAIYEAVPDLTARAVYLCGPDSFMDACKNHLDALNLPAGQLFRESFTPQITVSSSPNQRETVVRSCSAVGTYRVRFAKSGKTVSADGSASVLELARRSGVEIDHECLSGSCGMCMVKCLEGQMSVSEQAEIDESDRKRGWVYACCAYPASNMVLDI